MNRRIAASAAAAALLAGVCAAVVPQHAGSIVRVLSVSVVVVTAALVLAAVAPVVARSPAITALDRQAGPGASALDPHGLRDARRDLARPAAPGTLPAAVRARLVDAYGRAGADLHLPPNAGSRPSGRRDDVAVVSAAVHRALDHLERVHPSSVRPGARHDHH